MVALGLVALLVLLAACTGEPRAPQPPPLTLPSGPSTSGTVSRMVRSFASR